MTLSSFQNADQRAREDALASLRAIAESGTAGRQALEASKAEIGATQQAALDSALRRFDDPGFSRPISGGAREALLSQARQPGDVYAADNAQAQKLFNDDMARASAANARYHDQVRSAIPLVESRTRAAAQEIAAEAEFRREQRALERERMRLERERLEREKAGDIYDPFAELKKRYGVDGVNALLDSAGASVRAGTLAKNNAVLSSPRGRNAIANYELREDSRLTSTASDAAMRRRAADEIGLSDADFTALEAARPAPKVTPSRDDEVAKKIGAHSTSQLGEIRRSSAYRKAKSAVEALLTNGVPQAVDETKGIDPSDPKTYVLKPASRARILQALNADPSLRRRPLTKKLILAELAGLL